MWLRPFRLSRNAFCFLVPSVGAGGEGIGARFRKRALHRQECGPQSLLQGLKPNLRQRWYVGALRGGGTRRPHLLGKERRGRGISSGRNSGMGRRSPCADPSCVRVNRRTQTVRKKKQGRSGRNDEIFV